MPTSIIKWSISLGLIRLLLFLTIYFNQSTDAQWQLDYLIFWASDFPVSIIYFALPIPLAEGVIGYNMVVLTTDNLLENHNMAKKDKKMNHIKYALILFALLFSVPAYAEWVDKQGNKIPDSDSMKSAGDLVAQLVITDNEAQVLKNWGTPSQSVYFPTVDKIKRNEVITAFIVFGGCAVGPNGNCDLRMQITVYQPDGKIYSKLPVMEVWSGKPTPPNRSLGLSVEYMRIIIEPSDQLGKYKVNTKIIDEISSNSIVLTSHFTAVEANE